MLQNLIKMYTEHEKKTITNKVHVISRKRKKNEITTGQMVNYSEIVDKNTIN